MGGQLISPREFIDEHLCRRPCYLLTRRLAILLTFDWPHDCHSAYPISVPLHFHDGFGRQLFIPCVHLGCRFCSVIWFDRLCDEKNKFVEPLNLLSLRLTSSMEEASPTIHDYF